MKNTQSLFIAVLFTLMAPLLSAQSLLLKSAKKSFNHFHYVRAMDLYEKVIMADSANIEALTNLSHCYDKLEDTRNQNRILSRLYALKALSPELMQKYAFVLAENGDYEKSLAIYTSLKDPKSMAFAAAYKNIKSFYLDSTDYKIYDLKDLNSEQSDFCPTQFGKGFVFVSARAHHHSHNKAFAWNNSPFLNLYYVDTLKLWKSRYQTTVKEDYVSENHLVLASTEHDQFHSDVTEFNPNDTRTHGNHTPKNYNLAFQNSTIKSFGKQLNTKYHEGPVAFSTDFKTVYFTRSNYHKGKYSKSAEGINKLKIYTATISNDSVWDNITEMNFNSNEYSCGSPSISKNNQVLFFVSDQPGGFGGKDIYYCKWEQGTWSKPVNMGSRINTPNNEMFPHIGPDSILYFSSDGIPGLGGLDMFQVNLNNETAKVTNLGFPLNSNKDDFGMMLYPDNASGYFSSNRKKQTHDDDIYFFKRDFKLLLKGKITDKNTKKKIAYAYIFIKDEKGQIIDSVQSDKNGFYNSKAISTNHEYQLWVKRPGFYADSMVFNTKKNIANDSLIKDFALKRSNLKVEGFVITSDTKQPLTNIPLELFDDCSKQTVKVMTDAKGFYSLTLKPNCCYVISTVLPNCGELTTKADATQIHKDVYRLDLSVLCKGDIIKIENIYYDLDKWEIRPDAAQELDKLLALFKMYPDLKIELRSHTDCRSSALSNQILSDRRAKRAAEYLVSKGVKNSQITGRGYGEKLLVNNCSCEDNNISKPCSEEEHQLNRRTEIVILGVGTFSEVKHRLKVHAMCHE